MATSYESFDQTFKVALIQMCPKPLDPAANFETASSQIRSAASQGASLAVLPEYHLTSWTPESPKFAVIAETAYEYVPKYQALAKELKINIVAGTIVTTAPQPSNQRNDNASTSKKPALLNVAPFISYTGEVLGTYTKANLWHPERPHLTSSAAHARSTTAKTNGGTHADPDATPSPPSSLHSVIETPLGPVGMLVCWDLAFPEAFRSLILAGARIIIIPSFWLNEDLSSHGLGHVKDSEVAFMNSALVSRAFENTCCIIFCNAGGPASEGYAGVSQVAMPLSGALPGSFKNSEEGIRIIEVDMNVLDAAEKIYKVREDLAKSDWHYGYNRS